MDDERFFEKFGLVLEAGGKVAADSPLDSDNWDSVRVVETIALVDEEFGVVLAAKDLGGCRTAGDVLALVRRSLEG